ncbi:flagellar hook-basal body complex protein [Aliishimia ponticola]|uniref:Flagellar hook protein FlgE n=1 Tax=Aliishimia ponticola TaxID=2499833 RepID=A0A4S4N8Y1_9RHOB|nr:flagellar hook-basal body complex protein [Aliishimia ponticola]THH34807.1 flagellar hook-basal body complex protein [Aliishimia ponticola]
MTISSSLNAGVMALSANATKLATISDNIANASTYGYKRVEAEFSSMVIDSTGGSYSAGGVRATSHRLVDERGALVSTSNGTDLSVRGQGMLPVAQLSEIETDNGDPQMYLTTTGSFRQNQDGYLTTETGLVLMGWPADADGTVPNFPRDSSDGLEPIQINVNQFTSDPTTSIDLGVNLPATSTEVDADIETEVLSIEYYDNLGTSESLNITFTPTVPVSPATDASNEWTMVLTDSASGGATIGEYTLTFSDGSTDGGTLASVATISGGTYDAAEGTIIVNVDGGPIEIDIGTIGDADGLSQLSDNFAPVFINKDGTPVGNLVDIEVDANGTLSAYFDTGITRTIYQIPLADLPNPNGMTALDFQTYLPSVESGSFFLWDAGDGPTGDIVAFSREESTTDVANELTDMIQTQRAYSSNAKVIQTVDEMLQETTNIKR